MGNFQNALAHFSENLTILYSIISTPSPERTDWTAFEADLEFAAKEFDEIKTFVDAVDHAEAQAPTRTLTRNASDPSDDSMF